MQVFLRVVQSASGIEVLKRDISTEPGKVLARYQLSALKLIQNDFDGAMEQFLEIVRRDSAFREDAGRKGLVAIFNMPGNEHEAVATYRALLAEALQ